MHSKAPRIGGFRGHSSIYARGLFKVISNNVNAYKKE
jgi:hypothetical protein